MTDHSEPAVLVIRDGADHWLATQLDSDTAITLIAVASEDPNCWDEVVGYWPRYRTPVVCEFAESLPLTSVDHETATSAIGETDAWAVIDLDQKRIVTGPEFHPVGRDEAFAMVVDEDGRQHCPLSIHLPPWWELHEHTDVKVIDQPRRSPMNRPVVNREVLSGEPLLIDVADRVMNIAGSDRWPTACNEDADNNGRAFYPLTLEVHREWLMTPRDDLGGLMPRQMLHGGHEWNSRLVWAQRLRFEDSGQEDSGQIVAAPNDVAGYETAPMGHEEMVMYFDLCRELIGAAWEWCDTDEARRCLEDGDDGRSALLDFLREAKSAWLSGPFEGGSPPCFIIECSRRRVPRGANVSIVGMSDREPVEQLPGGDCPICDMMADGMFGTAFTGIDGHHLDLDDEFAFSMHETREEWEKQQREFEEMSAEMDRKRAEREAAGEAEPDEFASAWSGQMTDAPIPGDNSGNLKLAFLLAEVVSVLESADAPRDDIRQLNNLFADFRKSETEDAAETGRQLGEHLDSLAGQFPQLVPRVADFHSRIDEQIRSGETAGDLEFPF